MSFRPVVLNADFAVAGQITRADLEHIAALGFKTVINNRPDGEGGPSQPSSGELEDEARRLGLAYRYVPVSPRGLDPAAIANFARAIEDAPRPVLAFCRSGARSHAIIQFVAGPGGPS